MAQSTAQHNPFMLMINPEVVFAAMEKSERLGQLNRRLCRPLDRISPADTGIPPAIDDEDAESNTGPLA